MDIYIIVRKREVWERGADAPHTYWVPEGKTFINKAGAEHYCASSSDLDHRLVSVNEFEELSDSCEHTTAEIKGTG